MDHLLEALVAFSDSEHSQIVAVILGHCGLIPVLCSSLKEAQPLLGRESIRLVFCEEQLSDATFRDMAKATSQLRSGLPLVVFSRVGDRTLHSEALQAGAFDCISPPLCEKQIEAILYKALLSEPARTGETLAECPAKKKRCSEDLGSTPIDRRAS